MTEGSTAPVNPLRAADDTAFFGHPRGLSTLFFTEMWERFSYYGMRAILTLFMVAPAAAGGLGFPDSKAGLIYGLYVGIVYLLSLPGGWIADRFIGQRKAVLYGGVLIMFGHIALAVPRIETFYAGLCFIALGTGLLKPNVSTIVGQLYSPEDKRRDSGFAIYYMGINIGAFFGVLAVGFLGQSTTFRGWLVDLGISPHAAWHFGFGAAAVGMFLGLGQYLLGDRHLGDAGLRPVPPESPQAAAHNRGILVGILVSLVAIPGIVLVLYLVGVPIREKHIMFGMSVLLLVLATGFFVLMFATGNWTADERKRLWVILILFVGAILFFGVFEQAGSTFTLFAERNTRNEIPLVGWGFPSSYWQNANAIMIIALSPVFAWLWLRLERRPHKPSGPLKKIGMGLILLGAGCLFMVPAARLIGAGNAKVGPGWLFNLYLLHTCAELCVSPVGLSWTTRLAPQRIAGLAMGVWFMGTAIGNFISGISVGLTKSLSLTKFYLLMGGIPVIAGLLLFVLVRPLRGLFGSEGGAAARTGGH